MKLRISSLIPLLLILSSLVSSALLFGWEMRIANTNIEQQGRKSVTTILTHLQNMLDSQLANDNFEDARLSMSLEVLHPGIQTLLLVNEKDNILLANRYIWEGTQASVVTDFSNSAAAQVRSVRASSLNLNDGDQEMLIGYFPITLKLGAEGSNRIGVLFVEYDLSSQSAEAQYTAFQKVSYFAAIMIAIAIILALMLHSLVSKRVAWLMRASKQFALGDHDVRVQIHGDDELAELGNAFNQMASMRQIAYQAVESEQERFRFMLETSPVAVAIATKAGHHLVFANQRYAKLTNIDLDKIGEIDPKAFYLNPKDHEYVLENIGAGKDVFNKLVGLDIAGVGEKWVMASYLRLEYGGEPAVLGWFYDITARKQLEDQQQLAAAVFENSQEAILITDPKNRIISVNAAFTRVTGYAAEAMIGQSPSILSSGRHDQKFYDNLYRELATNDYWQGEIWDKRYNGEVYPKWLSISVIKDEKGEVKNYVAIFSDISERKHAQEKIEYLAQHDPLTGLPNRLLLHDRFDHAVTIADREKTGMAMLFLDLDNFKQINDSLGHEAGDKLLIHIAERLKECIREIDTVCRQGGDEFIILLHEIDDINAISRIAQKILDVIAQPYELEANVVSTSFSIGISLFPNDGKSFAMLQKKADTAMYHAKESGRNAYRFFTEKMNIDTLERFQLLNQLRDAIQKQEFILYYQPQIDIKTGHITGVEALIRWQHSKLGIINPVRFIPLAEESGLIIPIGEWVLQQACRQAKSWHESGLPKITVAVNLSSLQFKRGDIFETVCQALTNSGLEPQYLELELTETILLHDIEETMAVIQKLKYLGVKLSIDDFGTGYSSMSYLKQLKVDKLKIDQSFVSDLVDDSEDAAIVKAIIQLGESLQLNVIAEGVETKRQLEFLKSNGCNEAQGYYFSRPVTADKATHFIRTRVKEYGAPHLFLAK